MSATVLVVDDDLIVQDSVKCLLDTDGYEVTTAATGEEALSRLARQGFDVVVSDIKMPGLTGLDVLERSRMLSPRPGIVLMTGYATLDTAIEALRRGASDYLLKPFEVDDLRLGVQRALHHREPVEGVRPPGPAVIGQLSLRHLALELSTPPPAPEGLRTVLQRFEQQYLREVLAEVHDDKRAAARILQISLASLYRKLGSRRA
jgi:DNA-binding NtrC family response regulator